ncbi:hypothetical protein [Vibrio penaeicida]|uniref:Uncharacterized protein n=1 Tax=Vibrio penaeicida TaxID=104609 RepID=A0AAV5NLE7_9VIBR|nr:hypothetical protein [Vibrio penaeicida]RTZ24878.1 hypothetical protein EKN09_01010 [Vibrio penaeicida]GLQ71238.1 hypothetical protein GCM10007932_05980 [Vibrio penaeicida]
MHISKEAEQYILQCQLMAFDEEASESENTQGTVLAKSKSEARKLVEQGKTVIIDGKTMSKVEGRTYIGGSEAIHQRLRLGRNDVEMMSGAMRVMQQYIDHGSLDRMLNLLQKDAESSFDDFKEAIKPHSNIDETQYLIAKDLNEIEARAKDYPLIQAKQAATMFGELGAANPSRLVGKLKKEHKIIGFYFGNSRNIQIPVFQFDPINLGVYPPVEKLCRMLDGLNDWGVYKWLTTFDEDLECTPAQALSQPKLEGDLLYLAGLFKSESTLASLDFVAEGQDNE